MFRGVREDREVSRIQRPVDDRLDVVAGAGEGAGPRATFRLKLGDLLC